MNKIEFDCYAKNGEVQICVLADCHYGNEFHDETYLRAVIDYIEQTPNCYFILNGDLIENATVKAKSSVFANEVSVPTQITMMSNMLSKIVKQGKCINATIGNHEERSSKDVGINPMEMIIANLCKYDESLNERYLPNGAYTFISVHNATRKKATANHRDVALFTMYNLHGTNGGLKYSGATQKLDDLKNVIPAHIYVRSHTHKAETHDGKMFVIDHAHRNIKEEKCVFASNGAFLHYGGYAQKGQMDLISTSTPIITLSVKRHAFGGRNKQQEFYEKQIECVLRDKDWFLNQVRK